MSILIFAHVMMGCYLVDFYVSRLVLGMVTPSISFISPQCRVEMPLSKRRVARAIVSYDNVIQCRFRQRLAGFHLWISELDSKTGISKKNGIPSIRGATPDLHRPSIVNW